MHLCDRVSELALRRGQIIYRQIEKCRRIQGARRTGADHRSGKLACSENAERKRSGHSGDADFELRLTGLLHMGDHPDPELRTEGQRLFVESGFL